MFITPSFKKSLIVEQFQGNYLKLNYWNVRQQLDFQNNAFIYNIPWIASIRKRTGAKYVFM